MSGPALWEVVGGAEKGGILVRTGRGVDSPAAEGRLGHGARVREVELDGERLSYERVAGGGPDKGWVSTRLSNGRPLLERLFTVWEVVGGGDRGGVVVRAGRDVQSAQETTRLSTGALVAELALEGERLRYQRLSGLGPESGWVSTRLANSHNLLVRNGQFVRECEVGGSSPSARPSAGASEAAGRGGGRGGAEASGEPEPRREAETRVLALGLLSSLECGEEQPAFVVRAASVAVRDMAFGDAEEVGTLCRGDLAVVDGDLDLMPWVKLPSGSRVRRVGKPAEMAVLKEDAFMCVEASVHMVEPKPLAFRCGSQCAAVHLSVCGCQHWEVLHTLVLVVEGPSERRKRAGLLKQGDLLCPGASTLEGPPPACSAEWLRLGPDSLVWKPAAPSRACSQEDVAALDAGLRGEPSAPLEGGRTEGFVLKTHAELGRLVAPVDLRWEGPAEEAPREEGSDAEEPVEFERRGPSEVVPAKPVEFERRGPLEVRVDPLPEGELGPDAAWKAARRKAGAERDPSAWKTWLVAGSIGLLASKKSKDDPLLDLRAGDLLLQARASAKCDFPTCMWTTLSRGDQVFRNGYLLAQVCERVAYAMVCDRTGQELLLPCSSEDLEAVLVETCSGFGEPWEVLGEEVSARASDAHLAPLLGSALRGDVLGVEEVVPALHTWARLAEASDLRRQGALGPEPAREPTAPGAAPAAGCGVFESGAKGALVRPLGAEDRPGLRDVRLLLSPARLGVYLRVAEICHRRIWVDNLDTLWNGDRKRILPLADIEAKILAKDVIVLHARRAGRFVGGAIVRSIPVQNFTGAIEVNGSKIFLNPDNVAEDSLTRVAYVDCCATERDSHAGRPLWEAICQLPFAVVALHSVPLPSTLDFWRARGLWRPDPESPADQFKFLQDVQNCTAGRVSLALPELVKALPQHSLPLLLRAVPQQLPEGEAADEPRGGGV